jgi:hypothetical protein
MPTALQRRHDALLFTLAHPRDLATYARAATDLEALVTTVDRRVRTGGRTRLAGSGVAGTPVRGAWSWALVRWLVRRWPSVFSLAHCTGDGEAVADVVRLLVSASERELPELLDGDATAVVRAAFGAPADGAPADGAPADGAPADDARLCDARALDALVSALDRLPVTDAVRATLWARLGAELASTDALRREALHGALSFARAPAARPFLLPDGPERDVDVRGVLDAPPPREVPLPSAAATRLIEVARIVLALLGRETEPITHPSTVTLHDMGRGLRIALFALAPPQRLPFDSYVGFMAFRNGVPLAYGGAWIYPGRSKVGINVFPSQRGGESRWTFAQVLRLYRRRYAVHAFEAENYQLGHGNAEGLRTGAYWFYWRLGFRPADPAQARLAAREYARLRAGRGYVVPRRLLRALVAEGLVLTVAPDPVAPTDTAALTLAVHRTIMTRHGGDRRAAQRAAMRQLSRLLPLTARRGWTAGERAALAQWALPLAAIEDLAMWPVADRRALVGIVRAKAAPDERRHQQRLRRHTRLLDAWRRLSETA